MFYSSYFFKNEKFTLIGTLEHSLTNNYFCYKMLLNKRRNFMNNRKKKGSFAVTLIAVIGIIIVAGIGIYFVFSKIFKSKCDKIINIISLCCAIFLFLFLAFVIVSNL